MKATRRIASDARYIIASIALVTSMGVFASLGSMRRHDDVTPATAAPPMVIPPTTSSDCICGTNSTVQITNSSVLGVAPQEKITISSDDCTCSANDSGQDETISTSKAKEVVPDSTSSVTIESPNTLTIETNSENNSTNVSISSSGVEIKTADQN